MTKFLAYIFSLKVKKIRFLEVNSKNFVIPDVAIIPRHHLSVRHPTQHRGSYIRMTPQQIFHDAGIVADDCLDACHSDNVCCVVAEMS